MNKVWQFGVAVFLVAGAYWGMDYLGGRLYAHAPISLENLSGKSNIVPVLVVGSGPAGVMASIYAARAGLHVVNMEGFQPGGLLTTTTDVENWPGSINILGPDIIKGLRSQALASGVYFLQDSVKEIKTDVWPIVVQTEEGLELNCMSVIMATGSTPRKLGIKGEEEFWGNGVTSCALCDAPFFRNKDVVVVGGGDSATEETLQLLPYVRTVTLLVRKDKMRASQAMQDRLKNSRVKILYNHEPREVMGNEEDGVTALKVYDNNKKLEYILPTSGLFLAIGHDPNTELLKGSAVKIDEHGYIVPEGRSQKSSVSGVFAAGDVADPDYRQAGTSAGDGSKAGIDVQRFMQNLNWSVELQQDYEPLLFTPCCQAHSLTQLKTKSELDELIKSKSVIVDFYADYCPSCLQMLPVIESVAQRYLGKVEFAKVDIESAPEIVDYLKVLKVPCLVAFKDGKPIARYHQVLSKSDLIMFIDNNLV